MRDGLPPLIEIGEDFFHILPHLGFSLLAHAVSKD
jgi:hypothetical protein